MLRDDLFKFFRENVRGPVASIYSALQVASVDIKYSMLIAVSVTVCIIDF